ncbi:mycofactocin biosynthesis glycosyltransferase MftF [Pseudonocardia kunmingensis]|uniref:Mycofactocin system glycosyltransferase n=1 Tax=Pseudonocardia kunmingensis TaxID=630975 RepID=A0A543E280_9PSEU|nr:mycofactocin biosynthesis glycosyltransferase MftF [Pseudonocardia kunmingensis]TQM15682.1 mycofactocin system glycosyltransferase [Pseudonocardia kunmingensis]
MDQVLPDGMRVALDRQALVVDGGTVLFGGAPPRMLRLTAAAAALLDGGELEVGDPTSATLARRLLDAGIAHPVAQPASAVPAASEVTVVVPVKDRVDGLARLLSALPAGLGGTVVVDDGSADAAGIRAVAERAGATLLRHERARGPAAARNAGLATARTRLVAFLDSDVVPQPGWLEPLLARFADPAVALAAPRIVALAPLDGWLSRYEAVRSSLDQGAEPALVVPKSRVAYVPSAAMLVRRDAVGAGFDERMHVAEDVDLVLRLHETGWRMRYEPAARVAHDHRTTLRAWWLRKAYYGTGAAPLSLRHPGSVPPMVLNTWSAAVAVLLLRGRPLAALAALAVAAGAAERLARLLPVQEPRPVAARLIGLGALGTVAQTADAVTRHYWPVSLVACLVSRRARRTVAVIALAEGVLDWWRRRGNPDRPGLPAYLLARRLDDLAYGGGLWWGAIRHRTLGPLRPVGTGEGGRERPAAAR